MHESQQSCFWSVMNQWSALTNLTDFDNEDLTCRSLRFFLVNSSRSLRSYFVASLIVTAFFKKLIQTCFLVSRLKRSYLTVRVILLWIASSKSLTRLIVRNIISWLYLSFRRKIETRAFWWLSMKRVCTNTSASFRSTSAFQWWASWEMWNNWFFSVFELWSSSSTDIWTISILYSIERKERISRKVIVSDASTVLSRSKSYRSQKSHCIVRQYMNIRTDVEHITVKA